MPKYCKNCKLQGHNEKECFVLHPELYPKEEDVSEKEATAKEEMKKDGGQVNDEKGVEDTGKGKEKWHQENKTKNENNISFLLRFLLMILSLSQSPFVLIPSSGILLY